LYTGYPPFLVAHRVKLVRGYIIYIYGLIIVVFCSADRSVPDFTSCHIYIHIYTASCNVTSRPELVSLSRARKLCVFFFLLLLNIFEADKKKTKKNEKKTNENILSVLVYSFRWSFFCYTNSNGEPQIVYLYMIYNFL
jgi:hypothetical protein